MLNRREGHESGSEGQESIPEEVQEVAAGAAAAIAMGIQDNDVDDQPDAADAATEPVANEQMEVEIVQNPAEAEVGEVFQRNREPGKNTFDHF